MSEEGSFDGSQHRYPANQQSNRPIHSVKNRERMFLPRRVVTSFAYFDVAEAWVEFGLWPAAFTAETT